MNFIKNNNAAVGRNFAFLFSAGRNYARVHDDFVMCWILRGAWPAAGLRL
jgi:hypothetical protein